ncbi:TPA: hypothetical protein QEL15_001646 [Stenotrophomonas maltophilia]|nr:hypothetical protein [Stenotrophomonas maltophilia]
MTALFAGVFVAGCQQGVQQQAARSLAQVARIEKARAEAEATAAENLRAANACTGVLAEVDARTRAAIDEAVRQKALAQQQARQVQAAASADRKRAAAATAALQQARQQAACRQQLEQALCDAIPLL